MALGDSRTASRGVDVFIALPAWKVLISEGGAHVQHRQASLHRLSSAPCIGPKRKAKLGPWPQRDNTMKKSRNYVDSRFPHHKYSPQDDVEEVDSWDKVGR